jgi:hypothetical protein
MTMIIMKMMIMTIIIIKIIVIDHNSHPFLILIIHATFKTVRIITEIPRSTSILIDDVDDVFLLHSIVWLHYTHPAFLLLFNFCWK